MSDNQNNLSETPEVKPRGFSNKKNIIIIVLAGALALGGGITAVSIGVANHSSQSALSGIKLAERYLSELNYTQAVIEFQRVLEIEPMNVDAYLGLARAYLGLGENENAVEALCSGLEITGNSRVQNKIEELAAEYEKDIAGDSSNVDIALALARAYAGLGNSEKGVSLLRQKYESTTDERIQAAIDKIGNSSGSAKPSFAGSEKIEEYQKILESDPQNVDAYFDLADTYVELGDTEKAVEVLQRGFEFTGNSKLQKKLNKLLKELISKFKELIKIDPSNVEAYLGLAEAYIKLGENEKARDILGEGFETTHNARLQAMIALIPQSGGQTGTETSPETVSLPPFGSMGAVTIFGEEYDIATTEELDFNNKSVTDEMLVQIVPQIKQLVNLKSLKISENQISDIKTLAEFTNLTTLFLGNNQISDITPLAGLTNLTYLTLSNNQISDITLLAGLKNLRKLELQYNEISDITPLAGLTNLNVLILQNNQIRDITPLAGLINLTSLEMSVNQISDVTPLAGLKKLRRLALSKNQISDIAPLAGLINLREMYLFDNQISDITPLASLRNLTFLNSGGNPISDSDTAWLKEKLPNCNIR